MHHRTPLLPPRGIFVSTRLLFDQTLQPHLKDTLLQLMALSWMSPNHTTPRLTFTLLEQITGKDRNTLRGHLTALGTYGTALRLQYADVGQFNVILAAWLFTNRNAPGAAKLPQRVYEISYSYDDDNDHDDDDDVKNHQIHEEIIEVNHHHHHHHHHDDVNGQGVEDGGGTLEEPAADDQPAADDLPAAVELAEALEAPNEISEDDPFEGMPVNLTKEPEQEVFEAFAADLTPLAPLPEAAPDDLAGRGEDAPRSQCEKGPFRSGNVGKKRRGQDPDPSAESAPAPVELPEALRDALVAAGVFPGLVSDIARLAGEGAYSAEEVQALLDWCRHDAPDRPAGLFMFRLRKGARPPAQFKHPPCPRCGERGRHAPGCPRGYSAEF